MWSPHWSRGDDGLGGVPGQDWRGRPRGPWRHGVVGRVALSLERLPSLRRCSYNLARMAYRIVLAPQALEDLRRLSAATRAAVKDALEVHLRHQPGKTSRNRIKRLRGLARPHYRLRVDDTRVFYDLTEATVEVLAIVPKAEANLWLRQFGKGP